MTDNVHQLGHILLHLLGVCFCFLGQFFDIYNQFTGDYPEILNRTKVKNTVKYIENARLGGNCYLPYADGGHKQTYIHPPVAYSAKRLFGDAYVLPKYKIDDEFISHLPENTGKASAFRVLYGVDKFGLGDKIDVKEESIYYKESQIFIHKNKKYAFTAKGGCNLEMHNHNDVASFQIVVDGKGVVVDPGPAKYTWEYFNGGPEYRYSEEVFAAGSMGHSVPIVDGGYQFEGAKARAEILEATEGNFKMDIASAYNGVESLVVNYQMLDDSIKVSYDCKGIKESITFRFLSFNKPEKTVDGINVGVLVKSVSGLMPKIKEIKYMGHVNIMSANDQETIYAIDFTVDGKSNVKEEFEFII